MKFVVERDALVDAVNWVSKSISNRPITTALLGIVIDAGDEITLSGSDLETAAKAKFKVYPSAYANGYAVQVCKGKMPGSDGKKHCSGAYC